jgi:hypothetical protein
MTSAGASGLGKVPGHAVSRRRQCASLTTIKPKRATARIKRGHKEVKRAKRQVLVVVLGLNLLLLLGYRLRFRMGVRSSYSGHGNERDAHMDCRFC